MLVQERERRTGWVSLIVLLGAMSAGGIRSVEAQTAPPPGAGVCGSCHYDEALAYTFPAGHAAALDCIACHGDRRPNRVGRRHKTIDNCGTCHANVHAHPAKVANRQGRRQTRTCLNCHDPHGSRNINLVRETITTPSGANRPIEFNNLLGLSDGSFASASAPGTGVCEICHTTTRHYRADGTGQPHFTFSCLGCHRHNDGFMP